MSRLFSAAALVLVVSLTIQAAEPAASSAPASAPATAPTAQLPAGAMVRLGEVRLRHGGLITSLCFSPDGKRIVSAGTGIMDASGGNMMLGSVRVWDVSTGLEIRTLAEGMKQSMLAATYLTDGKFIAATTADGSTQLWDAQTFAAGEKLPFALAKGAFSAQAGLAAWSDGKAIHIYDLNARKETASFGDGGSPSLSADGKRVAAVKTTGKQQATVSVWEVQDGKPVKSFELDKATPTRMGIALSPDSRKLAVEMRPWGGAGGAVTLYDLETGKEDSKVPVQYGMMPTLVFSPDGKYLLATDAMSPMLIDVAKGQAVPDMALPNTGLGAVAFSADSNLLALSDYEGRIHLLDLQSGKEAGAGQALVAAALSPDAKTVITADESGRVDVWKAAGIKIASPTSAPAGSATRLLVSPSGKNFIVLGDANPLLYETAGGKNSGKLSPDLVALAAGFSPDGQRIILAGAGAVSVVDIASGKPAASASFDADIAEPRQSFVSGDGSTAVCAGARALSVLDLTADKPRLTNLPLAADNQGFFAQALSPGGDLLAGFAAADIVLMEVLTGKPALKLPRTPGANTLMARFSPDGRLLAVTGDSAVTVWDLAGQKVLARFAGHRGQMTEVAFSADSSTLVTASRDGTAILWKVPPVGPASQPADAKDPEALWKALGGDAEQAYTAVFALIAAPQTALDLFKKNLKPAAGVSAEELATVSALVEKMGNEQYAVREEASKKLSAMGASAKDALTEALKGVKDEETRGRIEELLKAIAAPAPEGAGQLQGLRAVLVLERIGSEPARKQLESLSGGDASARLTLAAKSAIARLKAQGK